VILIKSSLNYLRTHYLQSMLAILGIALGIAVMVAIDLAIVSSQKSFELSTKRVVGTATHQIVSSVNSYIDEDLYRKLKNNIGIRNLAPVIEDFVVYQTNLDSDYSASIIQSSNEKQVLKVLGLDPLAERLFRDLGFGNQIEFNQLKSDSPPCLISIKTAKNMGVNSGDTVKVRVGSLLRDLEIAGLIEDETSNYENLILMDIADAQELLLMHGKLSYIDLKTNKNQVFDSAFGTLAIDELQLKISSDYLIQRSESRSESVERMTESFNLNLRALSFLAMIVAIFLIYNSMSFSVVQRRKLIAVLRAIGASKREIFKMILSESVFFAIIGVVLGLALGLLLGKILMDLVAQTLNDIYFTLEVKEYNISSLSLIKGAVFGFVASLIAAISPAIDASRYSPLMAMSRTGFETKSNLDFKRLFLLGLILMVSACLILNFSLNLFFSFLALFFLLIGLAFVSPLIVLYITKIAEPLYRKLFSYTGVIALKSISSQLSRSSIAIATLMIAISMSIGLNITIKSFRETVSNWLDTSLKADIYISSPRLVSNKADKVLEPEFISDLSHQFGNELKEILSYRNIEANSSFGRINIASIKTSDSVRNLMDFKSSNARTWDNFISGDNWILISEPFAYKNNLRLGEEFEIKTLKGDIRFKVAGVFTDFGTESGIVMMPNFLYQEYFNDFEISSLGLILKTQTEDSVNAMIADIKKNFSDNYTLFIRSNFALKDESMTVFDRTFKLTNVLRWIAILVAFIAVLSSFMSLQLERLREFGILRATGFRPKQIADLLFIQTITMGIIAASLAIPAGIAQAFVMIYIINQRSFGWSLDLCIEPSFFISAIIYAVLASALAVVYPIIFANSNKITEALRYE
jgi:putative ABC transport system permease protein